MDIQLPPRLDLGSSQLNNNSVASTIGGHIAAIERDAKQKRDMVLAFAHSVDSFVTSYTTAKERKLASELSQKVVTFLSASIYAETDSAAPAPAYPCAATRWAINPSDIATRDILLTQENAEVTKRTLSAYSLEIPVTWFNYAVTNVPTGFHNLIGGMTLTDASLVSEEALAQTHQHPCANCHGPFDANHARCPAVPKRVNGKYIKPTRKELDAIRKHGELAFKTVNTPPPATPTPASSTGAPVIAPPKRKRGAVVTAHENAGQRAPKPDCAPRATNSTILPLCTPNPRNGSQILSSLMPDSDPPSDSNESIAEDEDELATLAPSKPWISTNSQTQNHPGYDCYSPVDSWIYDTPEDRESARPRVMTYIRKGAGLRVQQRRPIHSRDLLWTDVNGIAILNAYRQPTTPEVLDYVTHLTPSPKCLVGGDFNAWHDMFEPGVRSTHRGADLARWSSESNMDFIGTPGEPTHNAGHASQIGEEVELRHGGPKSARTHTANIWRLEKTHQTASTPETREFHKIVRKAKKAYWKDIINGVKDDKDLYKVINWHKLGTNLKAPPLVVNGNTVEGTMEKAETLWSEVLDRFSASDDLAQDPLEPWDGAGTLPWSDTISMEEVERNTIGVSSTSPGTDRVTVRLLKACWGSIKHTLQGLYSRCLSLCFFPQAWKLAEVAMLPKVGKKDRTSVRSWRPIALISCVSKGLERTIARRVAWTALTYGILSPQHGGALPKRSAMDLVACFTHDVELAFSKGLEVTMVTMDVQGAFDALLKRRLLDRMKTQGWPLTLLKLIDSFLTNRLVRVRLEDSTTPSHSVACGTPQGSPLSPVLYMLYLAELLSQDSNIRFGYADDICLYKASTSVDINVASLATEIRNIMHWGTRNKIAFAPEKLEMIHLTRKNGSRAPDCVVSPDLVIPPITTSPKKGDQPALRWLGVWFDRRLTFKRHVAERAGKARQIARHIRGLAKTVDGPPASALRKAVITCVIPSFGVWKERKHGTQAGRSPLGFSGLAAAQRSAPGDAGIPSAEAMLEEAKLRFALRIQTVDEAHPLVRRITPPIITRGRGAGSRQVAKTKVQRLGGLFPQVLRPTLRPPHYTHGCRVDPTGGVDKETAAAAFKTWWNDLPPDDVTIFSDGSEQYHERQKYVGYGYAIYQNRKQIGSGSGSINPISHVFDAEAIGAWRGLQHTLRMPQEVRSQRLWMCIDSTSVIWCLRANASASSQWAFIACQNAMQVYNIRIKWSPGHTEIEGNEAADRLADTGAHTPDCDPGPASLPTISGIGSIFRDLRSGAQQSWWIKRKAKLSAHYLKWDLTYRVGLPRSWTSLGTNYTGSSPSALPHGDFAWYHNKFRHANALTECSCGAAKAPMHLVHCPRSHKRFKDWPSRPPIPPTSNAEGLRYLTHLLSNPMDFAKFLDVTGCYTHLPYNSLA
ncbi:hypothetical protein DID88_003730 [Monilinia fructigena]|uniref:Reverse transcriptase domain-containing protein n=1 Tax=Monilinia fructigena TaxID=38457 RepID=A0A395ITP7_9HELO|nr:hypothetical protein DID88_003730 [Monilinia fructigena]